jgi:hypothetical protein
MMLSALNTFDTGNEPPEEWWVGESKTLRRLPYPRKTYCEIWNPQKERVPTSPNCEYTQSTVTDADDGNWTFVYGTDVKLLEDRIVKKITVNKGKDTSLLCIIEISYSKLFCKIVTNT